VEAPRLEGRRTTTMNDPLIAEGIAQAEKKALIHYAKTTSKKTEGHVYIRSFLTHKQYDNFAYWDRRFGAK